MEPVRITIAADADLTPALRASLEEWAALTNEVFAGIRQLSERVSKAADGLGILLCKYCGRKMNVSADSYAENPFCTVCLPERLAKATVESERKYGKIIGWEIGDDGYCRAVRKKPISTGAAHGE